jgi:hypothetical protein
MLYDMNKQELKNITALESSIPFVETFISWIKKKKLETPATFFLEMNRPLMPLAHPAAVLCGTFVAPFFGPDYYEKIEALRDPAILDAVLNRLAGRGPEDADGPQPKEIHP